MHEARIMTRKHWPAASKTVLLATLFGGSLCGAAATVFAGNPVSVDRVGRIFGFGWGDGYHACRDSGCRPGADLPPQGYADQFNSRKACSGCGPVYPPHTALPTPRHSLGHPVVSVPHLGNSCDLHCDSVPVAIPSGGIDSGSTDQTPTLLQPADTAGSSEAPLAHSAEETNSVEQTNPSVASPSSDAEVPHWIEALDEPGEGDGQAAVVHREDARDASVLSPEVSHEAAPMPSTEKLLLPADVNLTDEVEDQIVAADPVELTPPAEVIRQEPVERPATLLPRSLPKPAAESSDQDDLWLVPPPATRRLPTPDRDAEQGAHNPMTQQSVSVGAKQAPTQEVELPVKINPFNTNPNQVTKPNQVDPASGNAESPSGPEATDADSLLYQPPRVQSNPFMKPATAIPGRGTTSVRIAARPPQRLGDRAGLPDARSAAPQANAFSAKTASENAASSESGSPVPGNWNPVRQP